MRFKAKFHKNPKFFKDNFSSQSANYAAYRPGYPENLFRFLAGECREFKLAWDAGTGNGQAAKKLALHFENVYATDASSIQILNAVSGPNITYAVSNEQAPALKSHSVNLISVAQALHWFDTEVFYAEAERVLKKHGLIACWSYKLFRINSEIDREIDKFYSNTLGKYWDPERRLVETCYRTLSFPFREIRSPSYKMKAIWNFKSMIGILGSWSAVANFKKREGYDPVIQITERLRSAWGDVDQTKEVFWDISMRVGRIF
tara:strand:+ start:2306 stop:3085 length:780 start_codon:yes stop_codon:yes gene_type:complete